MYRGVGVVGLVRGYRELSTHTHNQTQSNTIRHTIKHNQQLTFFSSKAL
jgi:hypothetical protein